MSEVELDFVSLGVHLKSLLSVKHSVNVARTRLSSMKIFMKLIEGSN